MSKGENKCIPKWKVSKFHKNVNDLLESAKLELKAKKNQKEVFLGILEITDDIERILESEEDKQCNRKYLEVIKRKMLRLLEVNEITQMHFADNKARLGWCEIIGTGRKEDVEDDTIIREVKKGYLWKGKTLRFASVIIVKNVR